MIIIHLLLFVPAVIAGANGPTYVYNFKEGVAGKNDSMVADCQLDKRGASWGVTHFNIRFSAKLGDFAEGTILTAIDVTNLKTTNQAKIAKTSGGINNGYVWFHIDSAEGHGLKFQFKMWGRVPAGKQVLKRTGNCIPNSR